jgi:D-cysteine desulfhydrase family pyridoxal phosphate-dependent enzyme
LFRYERFVIKAPMTIKHSELLVEAPTPLQLARTPTPLHHLPRLSKLLGTSIYCKRDDLTGFAYGGNKLRKLEYLLADATQRGCDTLITSGSNQSNWCRAVAVAGATLGMEVHLVLQGPVPKAHTGNLRLSRIVGARMTHIDTEDESLLEVACSELEENLRARGRNPYRMIVGGSTALGSLGYVQAMREIMDQERLGGMHFSTIIHATGSAGTQAGLVAGAALFGWPGRIVGIAVSRSREHQVPKVRSLLQQVLSASAMVRAQVIVEDQYVGAGYRKSTPECLEAVEIFARTEGLFLDEVYTGKAAAGLIDLARRGRFAADEHVLFIHTGGTAQLFE